MSVLLYSSAKWSSALGNALYAQRIPKPRFWVPSSAVWLGVITQISAFVHGVEVQFALTVTAPPGKPMPLAFPGSTSCAGVTSQPVRVKPCPEVQDDPYAVLTLVLIVRLEAEPSDASVTLVTVGQAPVTHVHPASASVSPTTIWSPRAFLLVGACAARPRAGGQAQRV